MRWLRPRPRGPHQPSIYEHVRAHLAIDGRGLSGDGVRLPDQDEPDGGWAPGAMDGVVVYHMSPSVAGSAVDEVYYRIRAAVIHRGSGRAYRRLYEVLRRNPALAVVDPLLRRLTCSPLPAGLLRDLGERLATTASHREPVKYGIALLGLAGGPGDWDVLRVLGRHDEFTLFVAVALQNTGASEEEIWQLAQLVDGWGRIHLVERLRHTTNPRIRDWILRHGFRNTVLNEYLAHVAATTGGLLAALEQPHPDDEVLTAACDIVSALLVGGPAEDIDDYAEAAQAVRLLVGHLRRRARRLDHFLVVHRIGQFLAEETEAWSHRERRGWTSELRRVLAEHCAEITGRAMWRPLAVAGLDADDPAVVYQADQVAEILGIDRFPAHWRRLRGRGATATAADWYAVMNTATGEAVPEVLKFAAQTLPLADLAAGPVAQTPGVGRAHPAYQALDMVIQELGRYPGLGWPLVATALRSPLVRHRVQAVDTLRTWGQAAWPAGAWQAVRQARDEEPRADLRRWLDELLEPDST